MAQMLAAGKRLWLTLYSVIALWQWIPTSPMLTHWAKHWVVNRHKIVTLTAINTTITTVSEFVSRTAFSKSIHRDTDFAFFTKKGSGFKGINRQSLINIFMTLLASLIGAPVYFFGRRWCRFLFFVGFGLCNSMMGQSFTGLVCDGLVVISGHRLFFDLIYTGSLKFFMFEWFRRPIVRDSNFFKLFFHRGRQDMLTSFFKTGMLNILGFRG